MTQASIHFQAALQDVENLMNFHAQVGGVQRGRRSISLSSLNKSGIVLLCAAWETYVERVIDETAFGMIQLSAAPDQLPRPIFRLVTAHIRGDKNESVWSALVGDGWKDVAKGVVEHRTRSLNTPKTGPVQELFRVVLGIADVTDDWTWAKNPQAGVLQRLNDFVTLRGAIAHGEQPAQTVTKTQLTYAIDLIQRLVARIEARLI